jgi:hypothetical protein
MEVRRQNEYNQGISRYKLLSANAGVGSIITSNIGTYILVSDINKWDFINASNNRIADICKDPSLAPEDWYEAAKKEIGNTLGIDLVNDQRFIEFLKIDKGLENLLCLAAIPHLSLDDRYNTVNLKDKPVVKRLRERGIEKKEDNFTIPGTHFPKWFRNEDGRLKLYKEWREEWRRSGKPIWLFAPPRDPNKFYKNAKAIKIDATHTIPVHKELTQLNLILICENGHLSDIPWSHYLRWRTEKFLRSNEVTDLSFASKPCCDQPDLKWSENKNRSEGYGSVYLECLHCGLGNGKATDRPKINLEGITNLSPICPGHKPWEIPLEEGKDEIPVDENCCDKNKARSKMKVMLVTGNSVYFANTFSSVYIPTELITGLSEDMERALNICERRYESLREDRSRIDWADKRIDTDLLDELNILVVDRKAFIQQLKELFLTGIRTGQLDATEDLHEQYRRQEYEVFTKREHSPKPGLRFKDIELPPRLAPYFTRIKKIEELKLSSVQLDFTRGAPSERILGPDGKIIAGQGKSIFSIPEEKVHILPAVENYGEGIFFEFNREAIETWMDRHRDFLATRIERLMPIEGQFNGNALRQKIKRNEARSLLIHTFSHLLMRELEFTCGYPTASLKERLYIAPDMAGVLIFTAEGSEGSMGGLIWQAHPERILELLQKALEKALDCSSDPLCWESDGQGVFGLNLAACFSCALVAETACEERNLGLDRRVLIDDAFGFFATW